MDLYCLYGHNLSHCIVTTSLTVFVYSCDLLTLGSTTQEYDSLAHRLLSGSGPTGRTRRALVSLGLKMGFLRSLGSCPLCFYPNHQPLKSLITYLLTSLGLACPLSSS